MSAFIKERHFGRNLLFHNKLKRYLSYVGLGFIEVDGCYVDKKKNTVEEELSFFIPYNDKTHDTLEEFKKVLFEIGKKYDQDSILFLDEDQIAYYLYIDNRKPTKLGKIGLDKMGDAWTRLRKGSHKGRTFIFEGNVAPKGFMEAVLFQAKKIQGGF